MSACDFRLARTHTRPHIGTPSGCVPMKKGGQPRAGCRPFLLAAFFWINGINAGLLGLGVRFENAESKEEAKNEYDKNGNCSHNRQVLKGELFG